MLENRKHVRRPGNSRAAVIYTGGPNTPPIMCTLADISEGGAGLVVVDTAAIPETFVLEIKGENMRRSCKVAWRAAPHRVGVAFT